MAPDIMKTSTAKCFPFHIYLVESLFFFVTRENKWKLEKLTTMTSKFCNYIYIYVNIFAKFDFLVLLP